MNAVEQIRVRGAGLNLVGDAVGPADAPAILFLHGSGQTRQSWRRALNEAGARGYRAISLDLRGHGDSEWAPDGNYNLEAFAADIREVVPQLGVAPILVGASLGGLIGIMVGSADLSPLRALVLVDITPRIEFSGAKGVVSFMDSAPDGFESLEHAADAVAAYLPHRERPKDTSGLQRNLRLRNGRYYWHWDPAFARHGREATAKVNFDRPQSPLEHYARALRIPTLLIRGGRSEIVSEGSVREFLTMAPHAEYVDIKGAHHMVAGDANDAFNSAVFEFVDRQAAGGVAS